MSPKLHENIEGRTPRQTSARRVTNHNQEFVTIAEKYREVRKKQEH